MLARQSLLIVCFGKFSTSRLLIQKSLPRQRKESSSTCWSCSTMASPNSTISDQENLARQQVITGCIPNAYLKTSPVRANIKAPNVYKKDSAAETVFAERASHRILPLNMGSWKKRICQLYSNSPNETPLIQNWPGSYVAPCKCHVTSGYENVEDMVLSNFNLQGSMRLLEHRQLTILIVI